MTEVRGDLERVLGDVLAEEETDDDEPVGDEPELGELAPELSEEEACGSLEGFSEDELVPPDPVPLPGDEEVPLPTDEEEPPPAGEGGPTIVRVSRIDGVPLFYARGVAPHAVEFPIEPGFRDELTRTVKLVRKRAPDAFGRLVRITSAGAFVAKPGFHGLGRAFDHDAWLFEHVEISPFKGDHAASSRARRQRYWGLAALIRSRSAYVLHGDYNPDHRDHIHQDNGGPLAFTTGSEATVKLAQAICNEIYGTSPRLVVDGDFGSSSQAALRKAMQHVRLEGDVTDLAQWRRFLRRTGRLGFRLSLDH
jgi:hypothetical protein